MSIIDLLAEARCYRLFVSILADWSCEHSHKLVSVASLFSIDMAFGHLLHKKYFTIW